ncbi:serine/threonine protein kinase, partial [bacterium]
MSVPFRARYVVVKDIGRGGMGKVELVYDRDRGELVARKRMLGTGGVALVRFKDEFRSISSFAHRNLVKLHELAYDEEGVFFTMEYVDGIAFDAYARRGDEAIAKAARDLVSALAYLHARGIVHRDIKPTNVLVRADGTAKLIDFGVHARFGRGARPESANPAGSLPYLAPEVRLGAPPSPSTELFALGQLLFEAYAGARRAR